MVYNSLTEAPHNVKEGIDWLVALKGDDAEKNLVAMGAALYDFLAEKPVGHTHVPALEKVKRVTKTFMEQEGVKNVWPFKVMLQRFIKPVNTNPSWFSRLFNAVKESDYKNVVKTRGLTANTIAGQLSKAVDGCERFLDKIKVPDQYESSYSSEATWEASCSKKPEYCAAVLVGIAPMLYTGIRSLLKTSEDEVLRSAPFICGKSRIPTILEALGFKGAGCQDDMSRKYVLKAVGNVNFRMLDTLYDLSGFWAFYGSSTTDVDAEPSVDGEGEQSMIPEAEPSVDGEGEQSMIPEAEPSVDGEGEQSMIPEAEPSVDGEGEQSMIPEAEPSVDGEGEQSMIPEAEPSVDGEGEQSMIPEAEPSVDGEGEQSMIPEAEPSVDGEGEQSMIPEAEPSAEPVKPEVDEVEQPVKVAKAAKVARSVKAAKKAAKKVSKKARQKKQKKQQESAEQ
ncbi:hypothetical protein BBBOND_0203710 [Babesia bigemina]|uniref:Uncharacterized protein n=1 Tax=Babesia bigemina TaxID=5866 RepID=A0A061D3Q5_BABBI|nr:hypothetical protein BBBOND_0203710 [Babesia bigemina]CDR95213.1 hypothetical protein BBBOND_0203710 [Babesia bigemina]|eukprot:XP_012767399.1 hypothetical protein BBBOND_0203710 [Babesia bigemina]